MGKFSVEGEFTVEIGSAVNECYRVGDIVNAGIIPDRGRPSKAVDRRGPWRGSVRKPENLAALLNQNEVATNSIRWKVSWNESFLVDAWGPRAVEGMLRQAHLGRHASCIPLG
jgi:hypothetical protein